LKKEICFVVCLGLFATGFLSGSRYGRAQAQKPAPAAEGQGGCLDDGDSDQDASDLQSCLDDSRREQLNYIDWSGRHARHLEACSDALGEVARALARRRP
jgi:hypothetical protein